MSQLRPVVMVAIRDALNRTDFGLTSFGVAFPESGEYLANIKFLLAPAMFLSIGQTYGKLWIRCSPGDFRSEDLVDMATIDHCVQQIPGWANRIKADLAADAAKAEVDEFRELLEERLRTLKNPEQRFTGSEVQELNAKLMQFEARLRDLEEQQALSEKELSELRNAIASVRTDLPALPRGIWYRVAANKLWDVTKRVLKTKEAREVLASGAKKLLGLE